MRSQGPSRQVKKIVHPYENPFLHLKKLLGLEKQPQEFIKVKAALKRFARRLDPDRKVYQQGDAFNFVLNKLVDEYPKLYEGEEERLRYAGHIIASIHDRKQEGRWKVAPPVLDLTQPVALSESSASVPHKNIQDTRNDGPTISTAQNESGKEDHTSPNAAPIRGSQIGRVHKFLTSCHPSMGWSLFLFVEARWLSEDKLREVAGWSDTRIRTLLKNILAGPDGQRAVDERDIAILQRQLRDYYMM